MRATARLPGLEIEIVHRRSAEGDREQISINMLAVPSFDAFEQYLRAMNPFALWVEAARAVWAPWFEATRTATLPYVDSPKLTKGDPQPDSEKAE
ncbi:hypothetical protein [Bradyrhizobium sp. LMTR 3]|uniref:hypothetical protein n=1 Tax=Bradyrhizobium sp. LMTR 3 TaxID=189873 RepID=UPI00081085DD|nr:hypothetical protein [Bradyrhizobium sp. LMTR 3]OCK61690.1 hypothetical protein LMTR3_04035 [Bradyrhizobium sp. LMTR 3]